MTDKEIIKALECHIKRQCWNDCPNATEERQLLSKPCSQMIAEDALDLINRQQAEIAMYRQTVGTLAEKNGEVVGLLNGKETRYIKKDIAKIFENMAVNRARNEAIKEFAERLCEGRVSNDPVVIAVRCAEKEMTMEMEGYMSLSNNSTSELVVTCKTGANEYKKNYVYLNEYVIYVVEDITGTTTDPYHYKVKFYGATPDIDINH